MSTWETMDFCPQRNREAQHAAASRFSQKANGFQKKNIMGKRQMAARRQTQIENEETRGLESARQPRLHTDRKILSRPSPTTKMSGTTFAPSEELLAKSQGRAQRKKPREGRGEPARPEVPATPARQTTEAERAPPLQSKSEAANILNQAAAPGVY